MRPLPAAACVIAAHAAALLALASCRPLTPEPAQSRTINYELFLFARPGGGELVPGEIGRGGELFEQARAAYGRGEYLTAADGFMAAAVALRIAEGEPYWEVARKDRVWSYRNAAYAWAMANALDRAHAAFTEALAADPQCALELNQLLQKPPVPPRR
jgi:hypothetical protein